MLDKITCFLSFVFFFLASLIDVMLAMFHKKVVVRPKAEFSREIRITRRQR